MRTLLNAYKTYHRPPAFLPFYSAFLPFNLYKKEMFGTQKKPQNHRREFGPISGLLIEKELRNSGTRSSVPTGNVGVPPAYAFIGYEQPEAVDRVISGSCCVQNSQSRARVD